MRVYKRRDAVEKPDTQEVHDLLKNPDCGKRLNAEIGTVLVLQIEGVTGAVKGVFVGMRSNSYLIVELARVTGLGSKMYSGNHVVVKYVSGGVVYGFRSSIIGSYFNRPCNLLLLSCPEIVERVELRRHKRVDGYFPAVIHAGQASCKGVILDISRGGLRFVFDRAHTGEEPMLRLEQDVSIVSEHIPAFRDARVAGTVRSIREDRVRVEVGIQFKEPDPALLAGLDAYIDGVITYLER